MNLGDMVEWRANNTEHQGIIVAIVPSGAVIQLREPLYLIKSKSPLSKSKLKKMLSKGTGISARGRVSYIVDSNGQYYFPRLGVMRVVN